MELNGITLSLLVNGILIVAIIAILVTGHVIVIDLTNYETGQIENKARKV